MIPIPRFAPDRAVHNPEFTDGHLNIKPAADHWGPHPAFVSAGLAAITGGIAYGAFTAINEDGTSDTFAGTLTNLYRKVSGGAVWIEVSKSSGVYNLPIAERWTFTQFRNKLVAHNSVDPVQVFTLGSSGATNFADLAGSPPIAKYSWVAGPHLVLANLSTDPAAIHWSGVFNIEKWTARLNGSGTQSMPDGGPIQGGVGLDRGGYIAQATKWRIMQWIPGSGAQFAIKEFEEARGVLAPHSIVADGQRVFYWSDTGFFQLGNPSTPIGAELVDKWFDGYIDPASRLLVYGAVDPINKVVGWLFKSTDANDPHDKILYHDWSLPPERAWFVVNFTGADILPLWKTDHFVFGGFDANGILGYFDGTALEATMQTNDLDLAGNGRVTKIKGFTPLIDTATVHGKIGKRERHSDVTTLSSEKQANSLGNIKIRSAGRTLQFQVRVPAGTSWNKLTGLELLNPREGGRR